MAEIKDTALTFVFGIDFHIVCLDGNAAADDFRKNTKDILVRGGFFKYFKEVLVCHAADFNHFAEAVMEETGRQRADHGRIYIHGFGLVECTDEIFSSIDIDGDFPSDGAADLCQERSGHLHVGSPSPVSCRNKACHIADDTSAKADEQISCTEPEVCQRLAYTAHDRKASALFARRKNDLLYVQVLFFQLAFQILAIQFVNSFFRDNDCAPVTRQGGGFFPQAADDARVDHHIIRIIP